MISHALDFARTLTIQGITHVIAQDDFGHTVIADLNPNSDNPESAFPVHIKGPHGTGLEAILVNAIVWHINNTLGFESLRGIIFSGSETISGDTAIPNAWFLTAAYAAAGDHSYYDAVILPAWLARPQTPPSSRLPTPSVQPATPAPSTPPVVPTTAPTPIPIVAPTTPPDFFAQIFQRLAQLDMIAQQLAQTRADFEAFKHGAITSVPPSTITVTTPTSAKKPNESLPKKNPKRRG